MNGGGFWMSRMAEPALLAALKKEAKLLLREYRKHSPAATQRVLACWPLAAAPGARLKLAQTQLVVAREHGYRSWRHLRAAVPTETEREHVMDAKAAVDRVLAARRRNATVHVLTSDSRQAEAILKEARARVGQDDVVGMAVAGPATELPLVPAADIVVGPWNQFGFAYARQILAGEEERAELERLLAATFAVVAGVPDDERRSPCVVSRDREVLASVSFADLVGEYGTVVEVAL